MQKDILLTLTLHWRGLRLPTSEAWHLLELSNKDLDAFVLEHLPRHARTWRSEGLRELEWCEKHNIDVLPFFHPHYIKDLNAMSRSPWLLCVQGQVKNLSQPALTVVGGRQMSLAARAWMDQHLSEMLQETSFAIISGGARGVDQKAHCVSLRCGRATWAHLPSGLADIYPSSLSELKNLILDTGGGLISAYSPFQKMYKNHFYERNYNMALHSQYTLVVEARRRSGTLITAKASAEYGRGVGVVPCGPNEIGLGGLDLIKDGADIILSGQDLKDQWNYVLKTLRQ